MNNPASDWLVLIRPSVAGFDSTRDTTAAAVVTATVITSAVIASPKAHRGGDC